MGRHGVDGVYWLGWWEGKKMKGGEQRGKNGAGHFLTVGGQGKERKGEERKRAWRKGKSNKA